MWRVGFKFWRIGMQWKFLYHWGAKFYHWFMDIGARDGWKRKLPGLGAAWTDHRDFPALASRPFRDRWADLQDELEAIDAERRENET
jgi:hypothetical protein